MRTMKAALHDGAGTMRLAELPYPDPTPGAVVVRVRASGICGSDLYFYGIRKEPETSPGGHEVAGEIVELGADVHGLRVGDRVSVEGVGLGRACGRCWYCRQGQYVQCMDQGPSTGGGFAQFWRVPAKACFKLPDALSWDEGALVEPLSIGTHAVRRAGLRPYETVAVLGAGTIGLACMAAARAAGVHRLIATARYPHQAALARELGADEVVSPEGDALQNTVLEATEGRGADVTFEAVGGTSPNVLEQAIWVTRKQGRIVVAGAAKVPVPVNVITMLRREETLILAHCYGVLDGPHDFEVAMDLMACGRTPFKKTFTHHFPLAEVDRAFETARSQATGAVKVGIEP